MTGGKDAAVLDALAAVQAEARDYAQAAKFQKKALADPVFDEEHGAKARHRLTSYEQKKAWRE